MEKVFDFVGLEPLADLDVTKRLNSLEHTVQPEKETLRLLADFYKPHNKLFDTLTGTDFHLDEPS